MIIAFSLPATPEICFIFFLVLILFGPIKLIEFSKKFGKLFANFQQMKEDFKREMYGISPLPIVKKSDKIMAFQDSNQTKESLK